MAPVQHTDMSSCGTRNPEVVLNYHKKEFKLNESLVRRLGWMGTLDKAQQI